MKITLALAVSIGTLALCANAATVAQYDFTGTGTAALGSTIADATGNHNGTVEGGPLLYGTDPLMGSYLHFDADGTNVGGLGNRVVIPGHADFLFSLDQSYTMEVIFRTTQTGTNGALLSKGCTVANPPSQWYLRHQGNGQVRGVIEGFDTTSEPNATTTTASISDGQWHHVAFVLDAQANPKRTLVYVDNVQSAVNENIGGVSGIIGGTDAESVIIGELGTLPGNRSFAGDISAVRFSNAALTPGEFLAEGFTRIVNVTPADGSGFLPASTVAGFQVKSPNTGVSSGNIQVKLNGVDISGQLTITGTTADWTVTLPALAANTLYVMEASVVDNASRTVTARSGFNTFVENVMFIEGEDYNYSGGQFIDNPALGASSPYLGLVGTEGIDYHQTNVPAVLQYRYMDSAGLGTEESKDVLRQAYVDVGAVDFATRDHANSEWVNYTRTFAPDTYRVFARIAKTNMMQFVIGLDQVTSGSTTTTQTTAPLGRFSGAPIGTIAGYDLIPLRDPLGNEVAVTLGGVATLRLTMLSGGYGVLHNYLLFVPLSGVQRPFLAAVSPAPGAGNEPNNPPILVSLRNADTQVNTGSIQLRLDGSAVTPAVTPTSLGADVSFAPSSLSIGWHAAQLIFSDSAAVSVTNEWQFYVANLAVRGYWTFDEQAAGTEASTASGAILDLSGNARNGTVAAPGATYVAGSPEYGGTTALRLTTGADRVVVSDPSGNFNFTNSFTFEAVLRSTSTATSGSILAKNGTGDGEGEYWWRAPGATSGAQRLGANGAFLTGTNKLNDGAWHHVALVYDRTANQIRAYADYVHEGSVTLNTDRPIGRPADLQIGGFINTTSSEFVGDIDFVRISEGALSPAEFVQATPPPVELINVSRVGATFSFQFATQSGASYVVESTTALGAQWGEVETIPGNGEVKTVSYTIEGERKFFRVRSQ